MPSDNIKKYRKAKNLSQDDLTVKIYVVRQTLSKWENSLSVPDADQLIQLAVALDVSVNDLLGTNLEDQSNSENISIELAKSNEQIAQYATKNSQPCSNIFIRVIIAGALQRTTCLNWIGIDKVVNYHLYVPYRVLERKYGRLPPSVQSPSHFP